MILSQGGNSSFILVALVVRGRCLWTLEGEPRWR
jgi:hypothetical protein